MSEKVSRELEFLPPVVHCHPGQSAFSAAHDFMMPCSNVAQHCPMPSCERCVRVVFSS
ncbi:hypothetical protein DENSPDRAFT_842682 [Dentipellis sp. KUC8613]|nr:hypothetical protein DENSPDRAFT_842682 [Dentipellis sp. KUC8613]